jgi:hypothetical protein
MATAKAAAKGDVDKRVRARQFVAKLYSDPNSEMHWGFTRYHEQLAIEQCVQHPELITNFENGEYPPASSWPQYSPDKTWDSELHKRNSQGCCMKKGQYPPDSSNSERPPMPSKRFLGGGSNTSLLDNGSSGDPFKLALLDQMKSSNQAAIASNVLRAAQLFGDAGNLDMIQLGKHPLSSEQSTAVATLATGPPSKKKKLDELIAEKLGERKSALASGMQSTDVFVKAIDTSLGKLQEVKLKIESDELEKLLLEEDIPLS